MTALRTFVARLRALVRGSRLDRDLREEIETHVAEATEEYIQQGLPRDEARRRALVRLGGVAQVEETHRAVRAFGWVETVGRDVRHAVRSLRRTPGFTALVVVMLALGIGVNTLMFTLMNAVLFKPLPFPDGDRLVQVTMHTARQPQMRAGMTAALSFMLRDFDGPFDAFGVYDPGVRSVSVRGYGDEGSMELLRRHRITASALAAFGVAPLLGQFEALDDPSTSSVLLSYGVWQRHFAGDPAVVGQTTLVDGAARVIVGVMPPGFETFDGATSGRRGTGMSTPRGIRRTFSAASLGWRPA